MFVGSSAVIEFALLIYLAGGQITGALSFGSFRALGAADMVSLKAAQMAAGVGSLRFL